METLVETVIVLTIGTADGTRLGMNKIKNLFSLNNKYNVLF